MKAEEDAKRIRRYASLQADYEIRNAMYDRRVPQIVEEIERTRGVEAAQDSIDRVRSWQATGTRSRQAMQPRSASSLANDPYDRPRFSTTSRDAFAAVSTGRQPIVVTAPPIDAQPSPQALSTRQG